MPGWELKIITAEAQRLMAMAVEDAGLRAELRALAEDILRLTEVVQGPNRDGVVQGPNRDGEVGDGRTTPSTAQVELPKVAEPLRELTLGQSRSTPPVIPQSPAEGTRPYVTDADLAEIESRCRLKAVGARRAGARQRRIREGGETLEQSAPADPEIAACDDRLTNHFYWMNSPGASQPADISLLYELGGCFETLAAAIALVMDNGAVRPGRLEQSLPLIVEAQSALRAAILRINGPVDPDQVRIFEWLKRLAAQHHVYVKRYMRADDVADPSRWRDLLDRIERLDARYQQSRRRSQHDEEATDRLRRHCDLIRAGNGTELDWQELIKSIDEIVAAGTAPSNSEIRQLLVPVIDDLPDRDDLPRGFRLVLREIDRYLASRPTVSGAAVAHEPTAEVKEARRLLEGRSALLIGGICRRESQKLLKTSLGLTELIWIETKEHQSIGAFEFPIARQDVALVLLAIRWSSHAFGDVKQFCDRYGKPLVRLPGGYGPNQVAAQILAQCSEQLGGQ